MTLQQSKLKAMKLLYLILNVSGLCCFFATTTWPHILLTVTTLSFFNLLLNFWLVPGGSAWRTTSSKLQGPTGWPVLGSLMTYTSPLAHRKLAALATSMGAKRLMAMSLGGTRVIISSHPETAKEILCSPTFSDRPIKSSARALMFERAIGFAPSGDYWRSLRRLAANHMFSPKRINALEGLRHRVFEDMAKDLSIEMGIKGVVEPRGSLRKAALSNMLESVFGSDELRLEDVEELGLMVKKGYDFISEFSFEDYFPFGFLDLWGLKRRCLLLSNRVKIVIGKIVHDRKMVDFTSRNDHLSLLLSLPEEDQLKDEDLIAVLWETVFRGTDTVAVLVEWVMARMVMHPEAQAKARDELVTCVGNNKHVRDSDLPNLPYVQAIVKEVLRLHPPGPLLSWARLAIHDIHVDKIKIPAGTTAMVNMWAIAHDPTVWKDPWEFKPERFMEEDVSVMGSDLRLAPFGSGRRVCPGRALGLATVQLWVARLLHQFKWVPSGGSHPNPIDLSEYLRLSMEMKKPLSCCAIPLRTPSLMDQSLF